jgi:protein-disulfide isomerase
MSSRADQKRELREQREAREAEATAREQRRRRLLLLGASAVAAVVIAVVLIAISQGGGDDNGGGGGSGGAASDAAFVQRLYAGIPQSGASLGRRDAPLRMVEFADLQCPFCAQYTRDVLPTIVRRYVREGRLRLELRLLTFIGEDSRPAAAAAASAGVQNRMWQFADLFYLNQGQENSGYVTDDFLRRIAVGAGVKPGPVLAAANSSVTPPLVSASAAQANSLGVQSTPTFFVAGRGQPLRQLEISQLEPGEFTSKLDDALGGR